MPNTPQIFLSALPATNLQFMPHSLKFDHTAWPLRIYCFIDAGDDFMFVSLKWVTRVAYHYMFAQINTKNAASTQKNYLSRFVKILNLLDVRTNVMDIGPVIFHNAENDAGNNSHTIKIVPFSVKIMDAHHNNYNLRKIVIPLFEALCRWDSNIATETHSNLPNAS